MKKKLIIAALLAGVMAASCFTGCIGSGNGEDEEGQQQEQGTFQKGVEVTAEEWAAAINASINSQNFTVLEPKKETMTVTGYYKDNNKVPVNIEFGYNGGLYIFVDSGNDNPVYYSFLNSNLISGFADLYSHEADYTADWLESLKDLLSSNAIINNYEDLEESSTSDTYYVKIGDKYYDAYKYKDEWSVSERDFSGAALNDEFLPEFATEENGEEKPLTELYDVFTYSDGVYTAELWSWGMWTLSVSFKDGYILSLEIKATVLNSEEKDGLTITHVKEATLKICDIGKTSITPPPEAVKAVEDYIKENS